MRVAVQDANILIDLELANLLDSWLSLGVETHTTDLIVRQLVAGDHREALARIQSGHIRSHTLDASEMTEMVDLFMRLSGGPDLNDCSVLYLARKLEATLLTGDRPLRIEAERLQVEVHGTLWILDRVVEAAAISPAFAAARLRGLLDAGRFLPLRECEIRIRRWESGMTGMRPGGTGSKQEE